jgi:hypothetical protein
MALETNLNEKRKEKGKRNLTCAAGGLEACPSRLALLHLVDWAEPLFLPRFSSAPTWAGPGATAAARSLPYFADEWTPHVSCASFLLP